MRISEYRDLLVKALPLRKRILAVGKPGVGKTFAAVEAAERLDMDFIGLCSALEDPSTIRGYPSRGSDGLATHCLFDGIARAFKSEVPTLLFFDDLGMASESTMRAIMRLVQFGEVDGRKLPDCVCVGAASNDVTHGSGVYGMLEPLKDRFDTIVEVETSIDDVVVYGLAQGWPTCLLAYLRNTPEALHDWKPEKSMKSGGATPRGWEYVANWVRDGISDPEVLAGRVGKGRAAEYLAFRGLMSELPDVDAVLLDPDGAAVPGNPSARFLVAMALASRLNGRNMGQVVKYLNRLPAMFEVFTIRDALKAEGEKRAAKKLPADHAPIAAGRDFVAWSCSPRGQTMTGVAL